MVVVVVSGVHSVVVPFGGGARLEGTATSGSLSGT